MVRRRAVAVASVIATLVMVVVLTASFSSPGPNAEWEYLVVSTGKVYFSDSAEYDCKEAGDDMRVLNEIGRDGWELVTVVGQIGGDQEFVFKRSH